MLLQFFFLLFICLLCLAVDNFWSSMEDSLPKALAGQCQKETSVLSGENLCSSAILKYFIIRGQSSFRNVQAMIVLKGIGHAAD